MARTDIQRYQQALGHIHTLDNALSLEIDQILGVHAQQVGAEISLGGAGYWHSGSQAQHTAVRALMLAQIAFFRPPYAPADYASTWRLNRTRTTCLGLAIGQVNQLILEYVRAAGFTLHQLVTAAERDPSLTGAFDPVECNRSNPQIGTTPICYHGVASWLFSAGFVSRKWLASRYQRIIAQTANNILGDGPQIVEANWDTIPAGYVWNIHRVGDKTTCHWGISLGNGRAVACNNTDEGRLNYLPSNPPGHNWYGKFMLRDLCDILNLTHKYGYTGVPAANIVVRQFDPLQPPGTQYF